MHRDKARQAHGAGLELASKVHAHWKQKAPLMKRHIPGMHDREPDNGQATGRGGARANAARRKWSQSLGYLMAQREEQPRSCSIRRRGERQQMPTTRWPVVARTRHGCPKAAGRLGFRSHTTSRGGARRARGELRRS